MKQQQRVSNHCFLKWRGNSKTIQDLGDSIQKFRDMLIWNKKEQKSIWLHEDKSSFSMMTSISSFNHFVFMVKLFVS